MKRKALRIVLWIFVIIWMAVIFSFSAESGSASTDTSDGIVDRVVESMFGTSDRDVVPDSTRTNVTFIVRKCAHFTAYMLLGILTSAAIRIDVKRFIPQFFTSFVICVIYAISDEFHQTFVPGRDGRLFDVGIDSVGALCGILVLCVICVIARKMRKNVRG